MRMESVRNFSIVAHIDHGKSTLADRVLEITGTVEPSRMVEQVLDDMELERERGITIKSHAVKLTPYRGYELNLIDTPGHVDFTYEVSRALAACEGVVLLVDATQGIEAQTLSNLYLALENDLVIIPVINKIDLRSARIDETRDSLAELLGISPDEVLLVSAKTGEGVERLLERIIEVVPPPKGNPNSRLKALIFDSIYNPYRGVIPYTRVFDGTIKRGDKILMFSSGLAFEVDEVGYLGMKYEPTDALEAGEVGYLMANIKDIAHTRIGDTITDAEEPVESPLPGYREAKPMVFSGFYPANNEEFESLREALSKLKLNDASLIFEPETSTALGFGFRCGFLGLLHLEVTQERLEREYGLDLVATAPNVKYRVNLKTGETIFI
ncbi:elongation factor 4, partial [bacterium]